MIPYPGVLVVCYLVSDNFGVIAGAKQCDAGIEVEISDGAHGYLCFYDIESEELIGIEVFTDILEYCDDTSWTIAAGTVFDCPADTTMIPDANCPNTSDDGFDGGSGGAGGTGGMDSGRRDGSNGTVDPDDSGSDNDSGS